MKRTIYHSIFSLFSMAAVLCFGVSCEQGNVPEDNSPRFPESVTDHDVVPGTELTLTIHPNMAWSISIPIECYSWFKIKDGRFMVQTLNGVPSDEPKEIKIWTTDEESFSLRSCEVMMTMGDQTQTIASYTLQAKEKTLEVYRASRNENGAFTYVGGGEYDYEDAPMATADNISLIWDANEKKFHFPVKVVTNFEWSVEWPAWALADIDATSKIGEVFFEVYGVSSQLPMEDAEGEICFKDGDEVIRTYKVNIPGCKDIFTYTIGGNTSLTFDHAGYFRSDDGTASKDPVEGLMFGPSTSRILVLEKSVEGYVQPQNPWLSATLSSWDSVEGADVLQNREVSISAPRYTGTSAREALLLFLPATAPTAVADLLQAGGSGVKEEYSSYAVPVVQNACPSEYFTFDASDSEREEAGLIFEKSAANLLPEKNFTYAEGASTWQYNMSYVKDLAGSKSTFYITFPYETVEVYDKDGYEVTENLSEHWLRYSSLIDGLYGQVLMDMSVFTSVGAPTAIDGYLVFKDETGKVLSVLHCFYEEEKKTAEDVLEDVSSTMFVNPEAAKAAGASIYKVISGPTYETHKEYQAPIYVVRYTNDDTSLEIFTSRQCWMYSCPGKSNGPEMVTIDDQMYHDMEWDKQKEDYNNGLIASAPKEDDYRGTEGILTFGKTSFETRVYPGKSKFNMKRPDDVTDMKMSEIIQFGSSSSVLFVFICELVLE